MAASQSLSFCLISSFVVCALAAFCFSETHANGFTVDMFHRDSPDSPLYNPSETRLDRLSAAFRRSMNRAKHFSSSAASVSTNSAQATVVSNEGEYLVKISLGSPPFPIAAIVDTGSDLIWTQCEPCKQCYNQTAPLFDPRKSRTYREISCESSLCGEVGGALPCDQSSSSTCSYTVSYGDQSYTNGEIAVDTVTLGSTSSRSVSLPKTIIGCGFNNQGTFSKQGSGIVGLGGGSESLVTQMGSSIDGKFSYCLVPLFSDQANSSKLHFGKRALVLGETAVSTPLISGQQPTFYFLNLKAISVGKNRLDYTETPFGIPDGNIIIDSGTTLTLFPSSFYSKLESAVSEEITLKRVEDPGRYLSLCYESKSDEINVPKMTVHFDGADLELTMMNTFIRVSEDVLCFAFSTFDNGAIYGNIAQMNFLVGYDSIEKTVSFKPLDCTNTH